MKKCREWFVRQRRYFLYQLCLSLLAGISYQFYGIYEGERLEYWAGIYGVLLAGFDYRKIGVYLIPFCGICMLSIVLMEPETGSRGYMTKLRYGSNRRYRAEMVRSQMFFGIGMGVMTVTGLTAAAYITGWIRGNMVPFAAAEWVCGCVLYIINVICVLTMQTLLLVSNLDIRMLLGIEILFMAPVSFFQKLPVVCAWFDPFVWGALVYYRPLRESGLAMTAILPVEIFFLLFAGHVGGGEKKSWRFYYGGLIRK